MIATGKRHDFLVDYEVGFDDDGNILGVDYLYAARCGFSSDLSGPVTDRALFHCDNAYFLPAVKAVSAPLYTNTVSNTAFRGFGGPQGMVGMERVIDEVAFATGLDPLEVRKRNFYGTDERNVTPYHQTVEDNILDRIVGELEKSADYAGRRKDRSLQCPSRIIKRGIALTPVKFGISFTATHFNQAGALVHVYTDGSVHLNHGGTEMGQGLYVKVAQVVAEEFQIDASNVKITATTTGKVPNTSATAASSGTDLNGMAAQNAARQIKDRLTAFAAEKYEVPAEQIVFLPNRVGSATRRSPSATW
jgi:xanthine dehydrogenase large subunit